MIMTMAKRAGGFALVVAIAAVMAPDASATPDSKWRAGADDVSSGLVVPVATKARGKPGKKTGKASIASAGARLFKTLGCPACHSVAKKGISKSTPDVVKGGPDLSSVGRKFKKKRTLKAWLYQKSERRGKKHPVVFAGSQRQFDTLSSWLLRLK